MTDSFTITRTFAAPRALVYSMWTTPEHFSTWFGTDAVDVPLDRLSMDVRVGGAWKATMILPDGNTISWVGEYVELDPPSYLALTMTDNPSQPAGDPITVTLTEVDDGTQMVVVQPRHGFSDEQVAATIAGWNGFFDVMATLLDQA